MTGLELGAAALFGYLVFRQPQPAGAPGGRGGPPAPLPRNPAREQVLGVVRAEDGTYSVRPEWAAATYQQFEQLTASATSDPRVVVGQPRSAGVASLRSWCDGVIAAGWFVLMYVGGDGSLVVLRQVMADELSLARLDPVQWAVLLSPNALPSGMPAPAPAPPAPVSPVPGGGGAPPFVPGGSPAPAAVPAALLALPPELQPRVIQVYQSGTARECQDVAATLARSYPAAATELRHVAAQRTDTERVLAAAEGRLVKIPAGRVPSELAQHYADDWQAWPDLLATNPQLERKGDNLLPWKAGALLVLPAFWRFDRGPMASGTAPRKRAPQADAAAPGGAVARDPRPAPGEVKRPQARELAPPVPPGEVARNPRPNGAAVAGEEVEA